MVSEGAETTKTNSIRIEIPTDFDRKLIEDHQANNGKK